MMATISVEAPPRADAVAELADRFGAVRARVAAAARASGRDDAAVTIVAVSKTMSVQRVRDAVAAGIVDLGENRVQEAGAKIEAIGRGPCWHLVGHLQRNKAKRAVELFDLIHSIDSVEVARAVDEHAGRAGKRQRVLFQVNVSGEPAKHGFTPAAMRAAAAELAALPHIAAEGLMTIARLGAPAPELRAGFAALRSLRDELAPEFAGASWGHLSMGMTDDYEVAVAEGATIVRIGRAIFGERMREDNRP